MRQKITQLQKIVNKTHSPEATTATNGDAELPPEEAEEDAEESGAPTASLRLPLSALLSSVEADSGS